MSITTLPQSTTEFLRTTHYRCPDWCELEAGQHAIALVAGPGAGRAVVDHDGPHFGEFLSASGMTFAETGEVTLIEVGGNDVEGACMDAAGLRKLAADALAAAEWLEKATDALLERALRSGKAMKARRARRTLRLV